MNQEAPQPAAPTEVPATAESGWLNRKNVPYPQFQYQDTRNLLGFVSETHAAHQPTTDGPPKPFMPGVPRYMHDFGSRVEV